MIFMQLRHIQFIRVIPAVLSFYALLAVCDVAANVDLTRLPLGDGHISNKPEHGSVWACRPNRLGGRHSHGGPWIRSDRTFDLTAKPTVEGAISWAYQFTMTRVGEKRRIVGNGLPNHPTGTFPISRSTKAYQYDPNPNPIRPQDISLDLPAIPTVAASASCVPLGYIGFLITGGAFFNALDANGEDAVAHEMQDACQGHPQSRGIYHYHSLTTCAQDEGTEHSSVVGYAFDGFGLYGYRGEGGRVLTNAELDECHGHTHEIVWDDERKSMYHYHATAEYPYTLGCYRGQPVRLPRAPR